MARKVIQVSLNTVNDIDIIEHLQSKNASNYIKELIRRDLNGWGENTSHNGLLNQTQLNQVLSIINDKLTQIPQDDIKSVEDAPQEQKTIDEDIEFDPDVFDAIEDMEFNF